MADKVKGIEVQIGGDTTPFARSLKTLNSEIRGTQDRLKAVNQALKLDPKNTDLLKQKQKLLADQIGTTKEKLDKLKQSQQELSAKYEAGEIDKGKFDQMTAKVEKAEAQLKSLEAEAENVRQNLGNAATHIGDSMQTAGEKIEDVGQKLKVVSAAAAAALTAIVGVTMDFDSSMSKVAAISGATGEDFDALREKAREMGAETKFSASEAADAMGYMAMAGWKTEDMLSGIDGIMNLAAASGEDLALTSDIVTDALTAFGLTAADSGHFADVLAAASSNANTNVSMMGETFKYAAPIAGALGYSIDDVAEAIGLMANAGVKSSQAGTSLRTIMQRLQGTLELSAGAFGDVTIETANADGTMREFGDILGDLRWAFDQMTESEKASAAETLVGKQAMSGFLAIMNAAPADIEKLSSAIANAEGTAAGMAEVMQDNLSGQLTILKSQLSELAISIGDTLMPTIRKIVAKVQEFVDWLNNLDDGTKELIGRILAITAALAPVLIVVGKIVSAIGGVISSIGRLALNFTAFLAGLGPVGIGIAAVTAAMVALGISATDAYEEAAALTEAEQATADKVSQLSAEYDALAEARQAATAQAEIQAEGERNLWTALSELVDENGRVIEGNEEAAAQIAEELAGALGIEIDIVDGVIQKWDELRGSVEQVIAAKKAEAILSANQQAYAEAVSKQTEAYNAYVEAQKQSEEQSKAVAEAEAELNRIVEEKNAKMEEAKNSALGSKQALEETANIETQYAGAIRQAELALQGAKDKQDTLNQTMETAKSTFENYSNTVINYEALTAAAANGSAAEIEQAITAMTLNLKTASTATKDELEAQAESYKAAYEQIQQAVDEGAPGVTQKMADQAKAAYEASKKELDKVPGQYTDEYAGAVKAVNAGGSKVAQAHMTEAKRAAQANKGEVSKIPGQYKQAMTDSKSAITSAGDGLYSSAKTATGKAAKGAKQGVSDNKASVQSSIKSMFSFSGVINDAMTWGKHMVDNLAKGITNNLPKLKTAADSAAKTVARPMTHTVPQEGPLKDELTWMPHMMENLARGIEDNKWRVLEQAQGLAAGLKDALEVNLNSGSLSATLNSRTTVELDGRVVADVVNEQLGVLV